MVKGSRQAEFPASVSHYGMMGGMATPKTTGNPAETDSDIDIPLTDTEQISKQLAHLDEGIHAIERQLAEVLSFIDAHRPALARGLALMDPGAKMRAMLPSRRK